MLAALPGSLPDFTRLLAGAYQDACSLARLLAGNSKKALFNNKR